MRKRLMLAMFALVASCAKLVGPAGADLDRMRVYESPPEQAFEIVGDVAGTDEYLHDLMRDMKTKAVSLGGDALLITFREVATPADQPQRVNIAAHVIRFRR